MADLSPVIETMEHRWMRAWVSGDVRTLKALTSREFRLVIASKPPVILDTATPGNVAVRIDPKTYADFYGVTEPLPSTYAATPRAPSGANVITLRFATSACSERW